MNGNEPAFPTTLPYSDSGLTKLEYFAGLAMQGILASDIEDMLDYETVADDAVEYARALIAELAKEGK